MYSQLYFDFNATTPCLPEVIDAMIPYFGTHFGNPSSSHHPFGWIAKSAVEDARNSIADNMKVPPADLIFTSGATESINTILHGVVRGNGNHRKHIITSKAEHKAVLDTCSHLQNQGFEVTYLDVDSRGLIPIEDLRNALQADTALVCLMHANNETGVIQPLTEIADLTHNNGSLLFSDTTQVLGKLELEAVLQNVDFACFSGHKIYGPKGIGLLYMKNNAAYNSLPGFIHGGGQQKGQRGGTLNTPLIVGLAKAIEISVAKQKEEFIRLQSLRDRLEEGLLKIEGSVSNNSGVDRLPNTAHFSFPYVDGPSLLNALSHKIGVSNGSACNSASVEPSHVLTNMGIERSLAFASLRLSLGALSTMAEVDKAIEIITGAIEAQRDGNILWERRPKS